MKTTDSNSTSINDFEKVASFLSAGWVGLLWLVTLLVAGCWVWASLTGSWGVSQKDFDSSLIALLPDQSELESDAEILARTRFNQYDGERMLFLIAGGDRQTSLDAVKQFERGLRRSNVFYSVVGQVSQEQTEEWVSFYHTYRYNLLAPEARNHLALLETDETNPVFQKALAAAGETPATAAETSFIDDPLHLFRDWQRNVAPESPFQLADGYLTREYQDNVYRLITTRLSGDAYDLEYQRAVEHAIAQAEDDLKPEIEVIKSGLLLQAAFGAKQAQRELSTIGIGSLVGIVLLMLYFFRRVRFLLVAILPIAMGCIFSLAISLLVFDKLHLITLAFGAGLVGVAIDYSLHFLCAERELEMHQIATKGSAVKVKFKRLALFKIFAGITLGLVSSALAYAAQGIAPFPGLRQMALFSACGLFGAWLTVVCWLPRLPIPRVKNNDARGLPTNFIASINWLLNRWPTINAVPVATAMVGLFIICFLSVSFLKMNDDGASLQVYPSEVSEADKFVRDFLQVVDNDRYFVLEATSEEELLLHEELLADRLEGFKERDELKEFWATSRWVPSLHRQALDRSLIDKAIYSEDGLLDELAQSLEARLLALKAAEVFIGAESKTLTVNDWLNHSLSDGQEFLWIGERDGKFYSIVALIGIESVSVVAQLEALANESTSVRFVNSEARVRQVLQKHREQLQIWIAVAYLAVLILLALRYRHLAWRVIAAPVLASLLTLAVLSISGAVVNIFNLLALLLVLGIGLDASIFLRESGRNTYSWVAVTMAGLTTFLAFSLLATSKTPVLHQFGITVAIGILAVWLLTPCFVDKQVE